VFSNPSTVQTFNLELTGSDSVTGGYAIQSEEFPYLPKTYFTGGRFNPSPEGDQLQGISVSANGEKLYVLSDNLQKISEYKMQFPYNINTASYTGVQLDLTSESNSGFTDLYFKPDGLSLYAITGNTPDSVYQYTLGTAWDLSTATYASKSFSIQTQETQPQGLAFDTYGRFMYIVGTLNDTVYQYSLSTPWDVSTASYNSVNKDISAQASGPVAVRLSYDGTKMWVAQNEAAYRYTLSTPWDVSTATYASSFYRIITSPGPFFTVPYPGQRDITQTFRSFFITEDGTKMYNLTSSFYALQTHIGTLETVTWPTSVQWVNGLQPPNPAPGQKDLYTFSTYDGGTTYWGQRTEENIG
jgi:hypothetical protein